MLMIVNSIRELGFRSLMEIYAESISSAGQEKYPQLSENEQILCAEQDFYSFLLDFFSDPETFYAIWNEQGSYCSALRVEWYEDGYLISGLETAPQNRKRGYAKALLAESLQYLLNMGDTKKVYSHISRKNRASIAVHKGCGFVKILDSARFVDGSVHADYDTYCFQR